MTAVVIGSVLLAWAWAKRAAIFRGSAEAYGRRKGRR